MAARPSRARTTLRSIVAATAARGAATTARSVGAAIGDQGFEVTRWSHSAAHTGSAPAAPRRAAAGVRARVCRTCAMRWSSCAARACPHQCAPKAVDEPLILRRQRPSACRRRPHSVASRTTDSRQQTACDAHASVPRPAGTAIAGGGGAGVYLWHGGDCSNEGQRFHAQQQRRVCDCCAHWCMQLIVGGRQRASHNGQLRTALAGFVVDCC